VEKTLIPFRQCSQDGFSLLEVIMAITLFAVFAAAMLVSQGYNVSDSSLTEEQLKLHHLSELKMNEILLNPPRLGGMQEESKETKAFEDSELSDYEYTLEWKKLRITDFEKIFTSLGSSAAQAGDDASGGATSDDATSSASDNYFDAENQSNRNSSIETLVFQKIRENIERIHWQLRITVKNKKTNYAYSLSRWLTNYDEQVRLEVNF
jgi:prepilin-type N-terminal cleavage/methylation domain-containing protein